MPNWTENSVRFEGNDAERAYKFVGDSFDFNKIVPMPKSLDVTSGSVTSDAIIVFATNKLEKEPIAANILPFMDNPFINSKDIEAYYHNLKANKNMTEDKLDELYNLGATYVSNKINYGATTWYDWRINHWGTKWNACEDYKEGDTYYFNTAWSTPREIFIALSEMFPDMAVIVEHTNEDAYEYKEDENGDYELVGHYTVTTEYVNGEILFENEEFIED